ncbi:MAG: PilN domain-containing protein [Salinisphaera sp.]|nr:PilN domain-containing protein [Salinisphaera sp.]
MMIKINLLDWREARREQRRRQFLNALVAACLVAAALVAAGVYGYNSAIDAQNARNGYLKHEIAKIEAKITDLNKLEKTRAALVARMRVIERLQTSRARVVRYFDQIIATVPEGVYLTSLKQKGNTTTVDGVAQSNARVSAYMVNLDASPLFADPQLGVIKSADAGARRQARFSLSFQTVAPEAMASHDEENTPAGGA